MSARASLRVPGFFIVGFLSPLAAVPAMDSKESVRQGPECNSFRIKYESRTSNLLRPDAPAIICAGALTFKKPLLWRWEESASGTTFHSCCDGRTVWQWQTNGQKVGRVTLWHLVPVIKTEGYESATAYSFHKAVPISQAFVNPVASCIKEFPQQAGLRLQEHGDEDVGGHPTSCYGLGTPRDGFKFWFDKKHGLLRKAVTNVNGSETKRLEVSELDLNVKIADPDFFRFPGPLGVELTDITDSVRKLVQASKHSR